MNLISHKPGNHRPEGQTESLWHSWEITVRSHSLATWLLPSFVLARFSLRVRKGFLISEFPVIEIIPFNNAVPVPSWTASLKMKGATTVLLPRVPKVYNWINTLFLFCWCCILCSNFLCYSSSATRPLKQRNPQDPLQKTTDKPLVKELKRKMGWWTGLTRWPCWRTPTSLPGKWDCSRPEISEITPLLWNVIRVVVV